MKLYAVCDKENDALKVRYSGRNYTPSVYDSKSAAKRVMSLLEADAIVEIDLEKCKIVYENA